MLRKTTIGIIAASMIAGAMTLAFAMGGAAGGGAAAGAGGAAAGAGGAAAGAGGAGGGPASGGTSRRNR